MDIQQYILSGAIEAYVLGIASAEEARELELLSEQYPEIAAALSDCRLTMESYARMHAQEAPGELKGQIWKQIAEQDIIPDSSPVMPQPVTPAPLRRASWAPAAMAAALGLLIGTTWMNIRSGSDKRILQNEIAQLRAGQSQMQQQMDLYKQQLQVFADPAMRNIPLAGVGTHSESSAIVLWDSRSGEVYLNLRSLPEAPKGKQYQLWAIVDGKPVDLGVFPKEVRAIVERMKGISRADMFAITLEQEGGSPTPTLDQMFVAGKA